MALLLKDIMSGKLEGKREGEDDSTPNFEPVCDFSDTVVDGVDSRGENFVLGVIDRFKEEEGAFFHVLLSEIIEGMVLFLRFIPCKDKGFLLGLPFI